MSKGNEIDKSIGYLYINGLGDGRTTPKDRLVRWWWRRAGRVIEHAHINWYDGGGLHDKERQVQEHVDDMLHRFGGVAMIGGSAGGGLALNVFASMKHQNVAAVMTHARVHVGEYDKMDRMSLWRRAHLDSDRPAQAFYDGVAKVDQTTIPDLSQDDKGRLLVLTQLTDLVVDLPLMDIPGVQTHRSLAFGHSGGFVAHLLGDRDLIIDFAETALSSAA